MRRLRACRYSQSPVRSPPFRLEQLGGKDAEHLIKWFVIHRMPRSIRYAARCLGASDINDIVQDVYVRILDGKLPPTNLALSTVVCNATRWMLLRVGCKARLNEHKAKLEPREALPRDLVECRDDIMKCLTNRELRDRVRRLLVTLPHRQRLVIELRYGLGDGAEYSLSQIGAVLSLSRERVRQVEATALRKLQHPCRSKWLLQFQKDR